jgi:hypothetical protein
LRVIEPDELEVLRGGIALFADLLDRQPLASVLTSRVDVEQAVARCLQGDSWGEVHAFLALKKEFKDWLAALRTFDDRTSSWLSRQYGRGAELDGFKRLLSSEYDANFAYRFACALRNVSEHADDVLTVARGGATELSPGRTRKRITLGWDGTELQAELPTLKRHRQG